LSHIFIVSEFVAVATHIYFVSEFVQRVNCLFQIRDFYYMYRHGTKPLEVYTMSMMIQGRLLYIDVIGGILYNCTTQFKA